MRKLIISKSLLIEQYIRKGKPASLIAKELKCSYTSVCNYLRLYNIRIRKNSEFQKGEKSSNFKDGRCLKKYYCKDCGKEISSTSGVYGQGRCSSCAKKYDYIVNPKKSKGKNNGMYGKRFSKKMKNKFREKSKNNWKNSKFREKTIKATFKALNMKPNKSEKLLAKILPKKYKYNKTIIIGGFLPDFINKKDKKIIELYGCYWHKCSKCKFGKGRKLDKNRVGIYELFGNYKTLIIWEHELKNINKLKNKIMEFHYDKK